MPCGIKPPSSNPCRPERDFLACLDRDCFSGCGIAPHASGAHLFAFHHRFEPVLPTYVERQANIFGDREGGKQMIGLEHEADMLASDLRSSAGRAPLVEAPQTRTVPSVGANMQPRIDRRVVLPLPDGPINTVNLPPLRVILTSFNACTCAGPLPRTLLTFLASMIDSVIASAQSQDRRERRGE